MISNTRMHSRRSILEKAGLAMQMDDGAVIIHRKKKKFNFSMESYYAQKQ